MGFELVPDLGPRGSAYDGEAIPMEVKVGLGLTGRCLCNEAVGPFLGGGGLVPLPWFTLSMVMKSFDDSPGQIPRSVRLV